MSNIAQVVTALLVTLSGGYLVQRGFFAALRGKPKQGGWLTAIGAILLLTGTVWVLTATSVIPTISPASLFAGACVDYDDDKHFFILGVGVIGGLLIAVIGSAVYKEENKSRRYWSYAIGFLGFAILIATVWSFVILPACLKEI